MYHSRFPGRNVDKLIDIDLASHFYRFSMASYVSMGMQMDKRCDS
jgi:hypothetical protein